LLIEFYVLSFFYILFWGCFNTQNFAAVIAFDNRHTYILTYTPDEQRKKHNNYRNKLDLKTVQIKTTKDFIKIKILF